jgi:hypothetical protein
MTRISSLASSVLVAGLTILPVAAFAQPTPANPVTKAPPAAMTNNATQATTTQAAKTEATAPVTGKPVVETKAQHAKLGTATHPVPAKSAEPKKS